MITAIDMNQKAFHEAILYFMRERENGNDNLCHIAITDFNNWFIFDAKDFDRLFWRNPRVKKIFTSHNDPSLLGDSTKEFYAAIKLEIPKLQADLITEESIDCAHFNIAVSHSEKELIAIYKLLSPDCLLKEFNPNDANSLNKEFYTELLYILGLEEIKENGKKIIARAAKPQAGSFYENISNKLGQYTKPNDFESVIKLIIIWVNRILFLKLLESQIVKWTNNPNHRFLKTNKIDEYDALEALFFDILAKPVKSRSSAKFDYIPYLNSSLFESHIDEKNGLYISNLADDTAINYYAKTVVKNTNSKRKDGQINTLAYLFEFLAAYDFGSDNDDDEFAANNKPLISSSVLGLIFEKINGYKDGSFYTPSFITMYMARESITRTVIQKFNATFNWHCETLTDLIYKDNVADSAAQIAASNTIIDNIKICDPAVGSGHFLVSALNEILYIKSALKIMVDDKGERIKDYSITVENDELILKAKAGGALFEYQKGDSEKTRVQKTLFKEKQKIIENCLFGVDINPNSVNICRLRLWIELLKNAYYKQDGQLDTLPNIDINIKCGNSLISRFGLADDLDSKTIKAEIQDYKLKVAQYKENVGSKRDVLEAINAMKAKFQEKLKSGHAVTQAFNKELSEYVREYDYESLSKDLAFVAFNLNLPRATHDMFGKPLDEKAKTKKREKVEEALTKAKEIESGAIYQNAFEWRFEFPEVLDEQGDFVGFDVVIGNPPYVQIKEISETDKSFFTNNYQFSNGRFKLFYFFIELTQKISCINAISSYIIPDRLLLNTQCYNIRDWLLSEQTIIELDSFDESVFENAVVDSVILFYKNSKNTATYISSKSNLK
jgi:adenine-specific DNA-methyltransferase